MRFNPASDLVVKLMAPLLRGMRSHLRSRGPAWRQKAKRTGTYVKEGRAKAVGDCPEMRRAVEQRLARRVTRLIGRGDPHSVKMAHKLLARA